MWEFLDSVKILLLLYFAQIWLNACILSDSLAKKGKTQTKQS